MPNTRQCDSREPSFSLAFGRQPVHFGVGIKTMGFLDRLFGKKKDEEGLRPVRGAGVYSDQGGKVVYNMLDPWMGKFMGRCVGAIKKSGIPAKGTGQFSVLLGEDQQAELPLDRFWERFQKSEDEEVFVEVAQAASELIKK